MSSASGPTRGPARGPGPGRAVLLGLLACVLGGCAGPAGDSFVLSEADYPGTFDAARRELVARGFVLERVDADAGVISTRPKPSAGLATPWDREQSSAAQEFDDLLHRQRRTVRVTFEPVRGERVPGVPESGASAPVDAPGPDAAVPEAQGPEAQGPDVQGPDVRPAEDAPIAPPVARRARVEVVLEREHRAGWRAESSSVFRSSYARDPALRARDLQPSYAVAIDRDDRLAARLASAIRSRAQRAQSERPAEPVAPTE